MAALQVMNSVEYNAFWSLHKLLYDNIPLHTTEYNLGGLDIEIMQSYPRDLSAYHKPSIIIQKIENDIAPIGFGGFIGQYYNADDNSLSDVFGSEYNITIQVDVATDNNSQCALLNSLIMERIFLYCKYNGGNRVKIYDFASDENNPQEIGFFKFSGSFNTAYFNNQYLTMSDRDYINHDYTSATRFEILTVQMSCPQQQYVDLSKGIKIFSHIIT